MFQIVSVFCYAVHFHSSDNLYRLFNVKMEVVSEVIISLLSFHVLCFLHTIKRIKRINFFAFYFLLAVEHAKQRGMFYIVLLFHF